MINLDDRLFKAVNGDELWLLCHVAKRINASRECWPSNATLCKETGWSIDKLQKVKKSLVSKNLMEVKVRKNKTGQQSNNYYIITRFIGVFVSLPDFQGGVGISDMGPLPENVGEPLPEKPTTEVSTNEVLTNKGDGVLFENTGKAVDIINKLNTIKERYGLKIGKKGEVNVTKERKAMIEARLKEFKQVTLQEVFDMLEHRCKVWKGTKFEKFIRVETLFQASKFMGYIEESVAQPDKDWTTVEQSNWEDQVTPNMTSGNQKYSGLW